MVDRRGHPAPIGSRGPVECTAAGATVDELDELAAPTGWLECQAAALRTRAQVLRDAGAAHGLAVLASGEGWVVEQATPRCSSASSTSIRPAGSSTPTAGSTRAGRRRAAGGGGRSSGAGLTVPRRATGLRAGLTDTEVQLVRLVRHGRSNRQIAAAMHYSMKTIEV